MSQTKRKASEISEDAKEGDQKLSDVQLIRPLQVAASALITEFKAFQDFWQDTMCWPSFIKIYKEWFCKSSFNYRPEVQWIEKLRGNWCWGKITYAHLPSLVNQHDKLFKNLKTEEKLVSRIWTKFGTKIESNQDEMMMEIWEKIGFKKHAKEWKSDHEQLLDCNLTEILLFYVSWRGSYGTRWSLPMFAWIFTHLYGELGLQWFFYVALVGMAIYPLPNRHESWGTDNLVESLQVAMDHFLGLESLEDHSRNPIWFKHLFVEFCGK